MFARRADPGIGQRITDRLRDRVEARLLRRLVGVIEIELVDELVERRGEIRLIRPRDSSNLRVLCAERRRHCLENLGKIGS